MLKLKVVMIRVMLLIKKKTEVEPEKHTKNTKYTKEDFIATKQGKEREPWVQKPLPFPDKKHKSKEEEHYNRFCEWMKPLFFANSFD